MARNVDVISIENKTISMESTNIGNGTNNGPNCQEPARRSSMVETRIVPIFKELLFSTLNFVIFYFICLLYFY